MCVRLPDWVSYLVSAGVSAPSADNSQPWRFTLNDGSLTLGADPARVEQGLGMHHPAISLALGACVENVSQAAVAAGFPPAWLCFAENRLSPSELLRVLAPTRDLDFPEGIPLQMRHTNRTQFARSRLPEELISRISAASFDGAGVAVLQESAEIDALAALLRRASEARFRDEEIHRWLSASLRFSEEEVARGDGLDVRTLALPPGGEVIMRLIADWRRMSRLNVLGAYKILALIEAASFKACGAIIAILGEGWGQREVLAAGRLMERVWIELNRQGLAVQPYYVLSDQFYRYETARTPRRLRVAVSAMVEKTKTTLDLGGRVPAILLRAGWAKADVPRSVRMPLSRVVTRSSR